MDKTFGYLILENELRKYGSWPSNKGLRGTTTLILLCILFVPAIIPLFVNTERINSPTNVSMILQEATLLLAGLFFLCLQGLFLCKRTKYMEMVQKLSHFKYGVPKGLRGTDRFLKWLVNSAHWLFYIGLFAVSRTMLFNTTCDEWHGKIVICELLVPWYRPFKLNTLELTVLTLFHDGCIFRMVIVSFCTLLSGYYSFEMILIRFDDLKEKIEDIKFVRNQRCSKKFQYVVLYHQHILRLFQMCTSLNADVIMSLKMVQSSTIIICAGKFALQPDIASALVLFLPLCGNSLLHILGQRVIDASAALNVAIYNLNWYDANVTLQKDVFIFMGATLEPLKLQHRFFGVVSNTDMKEDFKKFYSWFNWLLTFISK